MFSAHIAFAISISPPTAKRPSGVAWCRTDEKHPGWSYSGRAGDLNILVSTTGDYASYIILNQRLLFQTALMALNLSFKSTGTKAAVGTYVVPITFSLVPEAIAESATGNNVGVMTGATGMIEFTVSGDQVVGYTFISINAASVESDDGQFITLNISNTGNVDWRPEYAVATFTNQDDLTVITAENIPAERHFSLFLQVTE